MPSRAIIIGGRREGTFMLFLANLDRPALFASQKVYQKKPLILGILLVSAFSTSEFFKKFLKRPTCLVDAHLSYS